MVELLNPWGSWPRRGQLEPLSLSPLAKSSLIHSGGILGNMTIFSVHHDEGKCGELCYRLSLVRGPGFHILKEMSKPCVLLILRRKLIGYAISCQTCHLHRMYLFSFAFASFGFRGRLRSRVCADHYLGFLIGFLMGFLMGLVPGCLGIEFLK